MKKRLVVKISEGLGNQLFMYANAFSLKEKYQLDLFIDQYSGYYNKKSVSTFLLNNFNISSKYALKEYTFASNKRYLLKKFLQFIDKFADQKKFIFEKKNLDKSSFFSQIDLNKTKNLCFLDGNFESEKYFIDYRNELLKEFTFNNISRIKDNEYLKLIKTKNVVSICIRQNRYSERLNNKDDKNSIEKSHFFLNAQLEYIKEAIKYFKDKIENPIFLVWSNDFSNLDNYFSNEEYIFVINKENKILSDFYLLTQCKYFIIAPSTFSWWGAWLSNADDKICVRPKKLNNSNNIDFWPDRWIAI